VRRVFLLAFLTQLSSFSPQLSAATFTTNALITEADTAFDGQDTSEVRSVNAEPRWRFPNSPVEIRHSEFPIAPLFLTNGAVLDHSDLLPKSTNSI